MPPDTQPQNSSEMVMAMALRRTRRPTGQVYSGEDVIQSALLAKFRGAAIRRVD
jgi:hypothetical protein